MVAHQSASSFKIPQRGTAMTDSDADEFSRLFFPKSDGHGGDTIAEERKRIELLMTIDHLQAMLRQECCEDYQCSSKYLSRGTNNEDISDAVNDEWRRKICDWCYEVVDHYNFDREVVCIALNYLDRFVLSLSPQTVNRRQFQLVAVTSLYLSIKLHGGTGTFDGSPSSPSQGRRLSSQGRKRSQIGIEAFVGLSRGLFTARMIEEMEGALLQALGWRVNPPTSARFTAALLALLPPDEVHNGAVHDYLYDAARYHVELAVCCSELSLNHKPSVVAYASILNAMDPLDVTSLPVRVRSTFVSRVAAVASSTSASTSLRLDSREVLQAREYLRQICPRPLDFVAPSSLRHPASPTGVDVISMDADVAHDGGKASPTCVWELGQEQMDDDMHRRARSSSNSNTINAETPNRPDNNRRRRKRILQ